MNPATQVKDGQKTIGKLYIYISYLVGGLEHEFYFSIQLGIIIPTDKLIFFRGVETTNHIYIYTYIMWLKQ